MRPSSLLLLTAATLLLLLTLLPQPSEAGLKRRNPRRDRPKLQNPNKRYPKKKSRLASLFGGRRRKGPKRPPKELLNSEETGVYYYSLPPGATQRPRIILGDELNFNSLGIPDSPPPAKQPPALPTLKSLEQTPEFAEESPHQTSRNPHARKPKHSRGPGYRLRDNADWREHYVLEHEPTRPYKNPKHPPKVMDSMMRAAGELRNAYKAAVVQSAKVAKFTGHAMGKYFKGVRNIFVGGGNAYERKDGGGAVNDTPKPVSYAEHAHEEVEPTPVSSPPVHLDWGGSFWKYFYNQRNNGRVGSLSELEKKSVVL